MFTHVVVILPIRYKSRLISSFVQIIRQQSTNVDSS